MRFRTTGTLIWIATTALLIQARAVQADGSKFRALFQQRLDRVYADTEPEARRASKVNSCLELIKEWSGGQEKGARDIVARLEAVKLKTDLAESGGTGVIILLDTSGSMDRPPSSGGKRKMDGALAAARKTLNRLKAFHSAHPDRKLSVGLYRFSSTVQKVIALQRVSGSLPALPKLEPRGGTAIGLALLEARLVMNQARIKNQHIILITDGMNSMNLEPIKVIEVFNLLPKDEFPVLHFIAFDIGRGRFKKIEQLFLKEIYEARDSKQLGEVMKSLLHKQILAESGK